MRFRAVVQLATLFLLVSQRIAIATEASIPEAWLEPAIKIVSHFENSSAEGWGAVTPDFDCQGVSAGLLQRNVGRGSLWSKVLSKLPRSTFKEHMPTHGENFRVSFLSKGEVGALEFVRQLQSYKDRSTCKSGNARGARWTEEGRVFAQELSALMEGRLAMDAQRADVRETLQAAWNYAKWWVADRKGADVTPSFVELVFFADTLTFNGTWKKDANYTLVERLREGRTNKEVFTEILDYLASDVPDQVQAEEAKKNAKLWSTRVVTDDELDLLAFAYLVGKGLAKPDAVQFRLNTISRRGTIIFNDGYVNGDRQTFSSPSEQPN